MSRLQNKGRKLSLTLGVALSAAIVSLIGLMGLTFFSQHFFPKQVTLAEYGGKSCIIASPDFALYWIHSVDGTPWIEYYTRHDDHFILTETKFKNFGAGVPHYGTVIQSTDGMITYRLDQRVPEINWVADRAVESSLLFADGTRWQLYQEIEPFTLITLRATTLNGWQRFLKRNCYESHSD